MDARTSMRRTGLRSVASKDCLIFKVEIAEQDTVCPLSPVLRELPVGIVVADKNGEFTLFNREAERILGMGPEQVGAKRWSEVYGCYLTDKVTPFPSEKLPLSRALQGEEVRDELIYIKNAFQQNGVWIRATAKPLQSLPVAGGSAVVVLKDVTAQREAFETIELLSRAVEQTADSIVITDRTGVILYVNPAFETTTGFSRAEAVGSNPRILRSGQHSSEFYENMWSQILAGDPFRGTLVNRKKTGELYWAEQTITPIRDSSENISHFVSVLKDVTESRKQQEHEVQLKLARQVQQQFYVPAASLSGLEVGAAVYPAAETGGDYIDFIPRADACVDVAVGDVSGHGFDSALVMALTRAYVRAFSFLIPEVSEILEAVNRSLLADLHDNRYVTLLFARVDIEHGTLSYVSAGHVPGLVLGASGKLEAKIESTGLPLGLFETCGVRTGTTALNSGSILVFLTDGVTEAENKNGEQLSIERVIEYVNAHRLESAQQISDGVCECARAYADNYGQQDDIAAVILKVA